MYEQMFSIIVCQESESQDHNETLLYNQSDGPNFKNWSKSSVAEDVESQKYRPMMYNLVSLLYKTIFRNKNKTENKGARSLQRVVCAGRK